MRAYINKSSKSMRIWNALTEVSAGYPLLKVHQQGAIGDVGHEVGGRAQSALAAD